MKWGVGREGGAKRREAHVAVDRARVIHEREPEEGAEIQGRGSTGVTTRPN